MFQTYTEHYSANGTEEQIVRRWNGGPKGDTKKSTLPYWRKYCQEKKNQKRYMKKLLSLLEKEKD